MNERNVYFITGSSKGIGRALAERLLSEGARVIGLARSRAPELNALAGGVPGRLEQHEIDLALPGAGAALLDSLLAGLDPAELETVTLINNAGMLAPMQPLAEAEGEALHTHLQLNLLAPMQLCSAFIRHTQAWATRKTIVNISSGAGKKPYPGWSAYCTAKAGIDMLTRCIAAEQALQPLPVEAVAIAPGVVDTQMQQQIREVPADRFPEVGRFIELKQSGGLFSAEEAAERILALLEKRRFVSGDVLDVRTAGGDASDRQEQSPSS